MSDRVPIDRLPTLEQRIDDVRAVMDAAGVERAALRGASEGGPMCALFAATYPERTQALVLCGGYARRRPSADYPWAPTPEARRVFFDLIERDWGGEVDLATLAPSATDPRFREWWARYLRRSASPGAALALARMNTDVDITGILPAIRVPTLIVHRRGDRDVAFGGAEYMADRIPQAKLVPLDGEDHLPFVGDADTLLGEVEEFLTGTRASTEPGRVLATVLFTDIVGSTVTAAEHGDRNWRRTLDQHHAIVRRELVRFQGREINKAGDGFLAAFDGPARAIRCAQELIRELEATGISIRAGLHTGECEVVGDDLAGIAVHTGARVAALAGAGEVLVSSTVKDLVAGSGIEFEDRGKHSLRGVPGEWRIWRAR